MTNTDGPRDVTASESAKFKSTLNFIFAFLKNPLREISHVPEWSWSHILLVQFIISSLAGFAAGLLAMSSWKILQGALLFPIVTTAIGLVLAAFLYYYFQVFERRSISYQKISNMVFVAYFPFYVMHIPSEYFSLSSVIGMAFTGMLITVGLNSVFALEKKKALRLVSCLFALIFVLWIFQHLRNLRIDRTAEQQMENL